MIKTYRGNTLLPADAAGDPSYGENYMVTAYGEGGQVAAASAGVTITLRDGHGFHLGDKLLRLSGGAIEESTFRRVAVAPVNNQIQINSRLSVSVGDMLINLGPDTGSSVPIYDGSPINMYSDMAGDNADADQTVLTSAVGFYEYWHNAQATIWELLRDANGDPVDAIFDVYSFRESRNNRLNVMDYVTGGSGTKADPWTGWDGVVQAAVDAVAETSADPTTAIWGSRPIYFPAGIYQPEPGADVFSNVTMPDSQTGMFGLTVLGDGQYNTVLMLENSSENWFFDNYPSSTRKASWAFCTFKDMTFAGDNWSSAENPSPHENIPANANGFRIAGAPEQNFTFIRCDFQMLNQAMVFTGTNNSSEMRYYGCRFEKISGDVFTIDSSQSVNHGLWGCDIQSVQGNVFTCNKSARVHMYGGNVIMDANEDTPTQENWFLAATLNTAGNTSNFRCDGVGFELRSDYTGLVEKTGAGAGVLKAVFTGCAIQDRLAEASAHKEIVRLHDGADVKFDSCYIVEQGDTYEMRYRFTSTTSGQHKVGHLIFTDCTFPTTDDRSGSSLSEKVSWDSPGKGIFEAHRCTGIIGTASNTLDLEIHDGNGYGLIRDNSSPRTVKHYAVLMASDGGLPQGDDTSADVSLLLPEQAQIVRIYFHNGGGVGGDSNPIVYRVGSNDKVTEYANSSATGANQDDTHYMEYAPDVWLSVGTDTNKRRVRLWATGTGTAIVTGGMCVIEYF